MIPVSGSAYSYSYATLGEGIAWFIGWNLVLGVPASRSRPSRSGWSGYVVSLLEQLAHPPPGTRSPTRRSAMGSAAHCTSSRTGAIINVPAMADRRRSSRPSATSASNSLPFQFGHRRHQSDGDRCCSSSFGVSYINTGNWHPFIPAERRQFGHFRLERRDGGLGRHLLRLYRLRCDLHRRAGDARTRSATCRSASSQAS